MTLAILIALVLAFCAGVAESNRIIGELHRIAAEIHVRIANLEAKVKEKL